VAIQIGNVPVPALRAVVMEPEIDHPSG